MSIEKEILALAGCKKINESLLYSDSSNDEEEYDNEPFDENQMIQDTIDIVKRAISKEKVEYKKIYDYYNSMDEDEKYDDWKDVVEEEFKPIYAEILDEMYGSINRLLKVKYENDDFMDCLYDITLRWDGSYGRGGEDLSDLLSVLVGYLSDKKEIYDEIEKSKNGPHGFIRVGDNLDL